MNRGFQGSPARTGHPEWEPVGPGRSPGVTETKVGGKHIQYFGAAFNRKASPLRALTSLPRHDVQSWRDPRPSERGGGVGHWCSQRLTVRRRRQTERDKDKVREGRGWGDTLNGPED